MFLNLAVVEMSMPDSTRCIYRGLAYWLIQVSTYIDPSPLSTCLSCFIRTVESLNN
jgi:hypothetical protein